MGSRGVLSRASAVLRTLLSHSGTALVLAWLLYVYVFHSLANLPVRVNCFLEASERTLSSIVLAYCCTRLRQRLCWSIPPCVCARACCCHCR